MNDGGIILTSLITFVLVNQHNNVINWSLNQLDMLLFIKKCVIIIELRAKRAENF